MMCSFLGRPLSLLFGVGLLNLSLRLMPFRIMFRVLENIERDSSAFAVIVVELTLTVILSMSDSWLDINRQQRRDTLHKAVWHRTFPPKKHFDIE